MTNTILKGTHVFIPLICPATEKYFGKIIKPKKKALLGKLVYVKKVEGEKIVVSKTSSNMENWFFHELDIIKSIPKEEPLVKVSIQTFDPDNLVM